MSYLPAIEAELRRAGVQTWEVVSGKHYKVRFEFRGQKHTFVTPRSPSDNRGVKNAVADLRRIVGKPDRAKSKKKAALTSSQAGTPPQPPQQRRRG